LKKTKLAFAAAALVFANYANATIFTVSTAGVVKHGVDRLGLLGNGGATLDGLPFYLAVSFDLDATARYERDPLRYTRAYATVPYIVALTMGDVSYAFEVSGNPHESAIINNAFSTNNGTTDSVISGATGWDAFGRWVNIGQQFSTYGIRSNSLTQYLQTKTSSGTTNTNFQIGSGATSTGFYAYGPVIFTVNGAPATLPAPDPVPDPTPVPGPDSHAVPEPATAMLLGAGLLGFAAFRRRTSRH
jgi:hypothetical protein